MPLYDCEVTIRFAGVEAEDEREALELCYEAVGGVVFDHPTTSAPVYVETKVDER